MNNSVQIAQFSAAVKKYFLIIPALFMCLSVVGIPLAIIWFIGPGWIFSRRYFDSLECELTESKLKFSKGVFVKVDKTIPLENIQDLTFIEGPLLKAFGLSVLKVETAGNSGSPTADMRLIGIVGAREFRNLVLEQRDKIKHSRSGGTNAPNNDKLLEVMTEVRDLLKDIRDNGKS